MFFLKKLMMEKITKFFKLEKGKMTQTIRIFLGLIFITFGLNKMFDLFTLPAPPVGALPYWGGLIASKYLLPTVMVIEILSGVSLILNKYSRLSLLLLAPITYNILMYHLFLAPAGLILPILMVASQVYLIYKNRGEYKFLLN